MLLKGLFIIILPVYTIASISLSWTKSLSLQPGCSLVRLDSQGFSYTQQPLFTSAFAADTANCTPADLLFGPVYFENQCISQPFDENGNPQYCDENQDDETVAYIGQYLEEAKADQRKPWNVRVMNYSSCYEALENEGYYDLEQLQSQQVQSEFKSAYMQQDVLCVVSSPAKPVYALLINECQQTIDLQWKVDVGQEAKNICSEEGLQDWQIILIVIGSIVILVIICAIICCVQAVLKKKEQKKRQKERYFRSETVNPQLGRMNNNSGKQFAENSYPSGKWNENALRVQEDMSPPPIVL